MGDGRGRATAVDEEPITVALGRLDIDRHSVIVHSSLKTLGVFAGRRRGGGQGVAGSRANRTGAFVLYTGGRNARVRVSAVPWWDG